MVSIERNRILLSILAAALFFGVPGRCGAFVRYDFEQRYLVLPGRYMKDRCFIKRGAEWHSFMIVGSDSAIGWSVPGNEVTFAHVSTRDFRHWTPHPDVLAAGALAWDARNIWAPDVIPWGGGYRMYYTGVDSSVVQSMGVAESDDLFDWRVSPSDPLYHPDSSWAAWRAGAWSNCRDPDVFRIGDTLYALNTCSTKGGKGAIDVAVSADGLAWRDRGPLFVNDADSVLESVQLVEREGLWYLFFSEQDVLGV
jgi:beta-xylosidase